MQYFEDTAVIELCVTCNIHLERIKRPNLLRGNFICNGLVPVRVSPLGGIPSQHMTFFCLYDKETLVCVTGETSS